MYQAVSVLFCVACPALVSGGKAHIFDRGSATYEIHQSDDGDNTVGLCIMIEFWGCRERNMKRDRRLLLVYADLVKSIEGPSNRSVVSCRSGVCSMSEAMLPIRSGYNLARC